MAILTTKRCIHCKKLLGRENFNGSQRSRDGLAPSCRACVNRRRRQLDRQRLKPAEGANVVDAARHGQLKTKQIRPDAGLLQLLLRKTIEDFHTIKKRPAHVSQARLLIERGAVPHWTMICEAARGGHQALIDVLLESGVAVNVFVAAAIGDEQTLARLLEFDGELAKAAHKGVTALHYCGLSALGRNDKQRSASLVHCAQRLIQAGALVDAKAVVRNLPDVRPLQCVCWTGGNIELARLLLENDADPRGCLRFALGHFQRHGDGQYNIAELLLGAGIDVHEEGDDMLGNFAAHGAGEAVAWLLVHGVNPNVKSADGRTPLHWAAERNTGVKVVKLLLEHGADRRARTTDGHTPFDLARLNSKTRVAEFLQAAGSGRKKRQ